jgi:hypothetical protein
MHQNMQGGTMFHTFLILLLWQLSPQQELKVQALEKKRERERLINFDLLALINK